MQAIGQFDTTGKDYQPYTKPITVSVFGDTLRDENGFVIAVKDSYGDWVSPTMQALGLKSIIKVIE